MEKRILGLILSILGTIGVIFSAFSFINGGSSTRNIKLIVVLGVVGALFFFAGISLVKNTNDKAT